MSPYQKRVIDEKNDLDDKLEKLEQFIETNAGFQDLAIFDQELLNLQCTHMQEYSQILGQRINRF